MKFTLSLERRKTLNEWAIANKYHTDIPKYFNRQWLDDNEYADKNAVYEYIETRKKEKAKDDNAARRKAKALKKKKIYSAIIIANVLDKKSKGEVKKEYR